MHLKLADRPPKSIPIGLILGADYYWDIVTDEIIRGNGPTAVSSKLGYHLSGPFATSQVQPALMVRIHKCTIQQIDTPPHNSSRQNAASDHDRQMWSLPLNICGLWTQSR